MTYAAMEVHPKFDFVSEFLLEAEGGADRVVAGYEGEKQVVL